jgi:hypothetical protein
MTFTHCFIDQNCHDFFNCECILFICVTNFMWSFMLDVKSFMAYVCEWLKTDDDDDDNDHDYDDDNDDDESDYSFYN